MRHVLPVPRFMEGLDRVFTENIVEQGKSIQSSSSDKKIQQLRNSVK